MFVKRDKKYLKLWEEDMKNVFQTHREELDNLKLEVEKIKSHIISLRGFVNRRMAGEVPEETSKNTDGLDGLRR